MTERRTITVAVPTRDRPLEVLDFMRSLAAQTVCPDQFVLVDGGAPSDLPDRVRGLLSGLPIRFEYVCSPPGLALQRNAAIDASRGDLLFFFDDDVVLDPAYLERAVPCFDLLTFHSPVGGVQGSLLHPRCAAPATAAVYHLFGITHLVPDGPPRRYVAGHLRYVARPRGVVEIPALQGWGMAFRREVFLTERFEQYAPGCTQFEDVDFSFRAARRWSLVQTPLALADHRESANGRMSRAERLEQVVYWQCRAFERYGGHGPADVAGWVWSNAGMLGLSFLRSMLRGEPRPREVAAAAGRAYRRFGGEVIHGAGPRLDDAAPTGS